MSTTSERAAAFAAAMRAAMESPDREVEVTALDGTPMRIVKAPEPGVKARIEMLAGGAVSAVTVAWEPSEARPRTYPQNLPFIPKVGAGISTTTDERQSQTQVQWYGVPDVERTAEHLIEETLAEGWTSSPDQALTVASGRRMRFERGPEVRTIIVGEIQGHGVISLSDVRPASVT